MMMDNCSVTKGFFKVPVKNLKREGVVKFALKKQQSPGIRTPGIVKGNNSLKISHLVWFK